jgi:hypothetical protein
MISDGCPLPSEHRHAIAGESGDPQSMYLPSAGRNISLAFLGVMPAAEAPN